MGIRAKPDRIDQLQSTLDDTLSRGIMTEQQEQDCTYPVDKYTYSRSNDKEGLHLYQFGCGFFRDVIYGLMLLKQRHVDLAQSDDNLRRMGAFYMAAPQATTPAHKTTKRMHAITSIYKNIRSKQKDKHRIATLSPKFQRRSQRPSLFQRLRSSFPPSSF